MYASPLSTRTFEDEKRAASSHPPRVYDVSPREVSSSGNGMKQQDKGGCILHVCFHITGKGAKWSVHPSNTRFPFLSNKTWQVQHGRVGRMGKGPHFCFMAMSLRGPGRVHHKDVPIPPPILNSTFHPDPHLGPSPSLICTLKMVHPIRNRAIPGVIQRGRETPRDRRRDGRLSSPFRCRAWYGASDDA